MPEFLRELLEEPGLRKIAWGVPTGYVVTGLLVVFALFFDHFDLLPNTDILIFYLAPLKFATNTLMWWAIRKRILVLELSGLNQFADIVLLTAVIHFTGGPASPLTSLYFVVVAIIAMLTNVGVTVTAATIMVLSYAVMLTLISTGVLEIHDPFLKTMYQQNEVGWEIVVLDVFKLLTLMAIMVGSISAVLRMLRARENELKLKNEELLEASRLKSQFIANVTHELRTPIHGVLGLSEMLDEGIYGELKASQRTAISNIERSAQTLLGMVDDLLSLARAERGRIVLRPVLVEVDEVLDELADVARWIAGPKPLEIIVSSPGGDRQLTCDRAALMHILTNLVSNAVKFTEQGAVSIRAHHEPSGVVFEVEDTGIGIPAEELDSIFEAFEQVDGSESRQYGGAGLGLSVVANLCNALGATFRVDSTPGKGSCFAVTVPWQPPEVDSSGEVESV